MRGSPPRRSRSWAGLFAKVETAILEDEEVTEQANASAFGRIGADAKPGDVLVLYRGAGAWGPETQVREMELTGAWAAVAATARASAMSRRISLAPLQ